MCNCVSVVCAWGLLLSVCLGGNQRSGHRHQVNTCFCSSENPTPDLSLISVFFSPYCSFNSSSLSQWVHACDALELPAQQREQLDSFIDQLYKDIEKGQSFYLSAAEFSEKKGGKKVLSAEQILTLIVRVFICVCVAVYSRYFAAQMQ